MINEIFSVKFTYNTQRIEGSTLLLKNHPWLCHEGLHNGGGVVWGKWWRNKGFIKN